MSGYARTLAIAAIALLAIEGFGSAQTSAPTNALPNPYRSSRTGERTEDLGIDQRGRRRPDGKRLGRRTLRRTRRPARSIRARRLPAPIELDPIMKFDASGKLLKTSAPDWSCFRTACMSTARQCG